jgi:lathosterol oxidase
MMSNWEIVTLIVVAVLGHAMSLFWLVAETFDFRICRDKIYAITISKEQIRREAKNSIHTPIHAVLLGIFLLLGFFQNTGWASYTISLLLTFVWAEAWHYISHRIFHTQRFHWIHVEHHRSHLSSPFTALSFSFTEKLVFDLGILGVLALVDRFYSLNFYGVAGWYIGYLVINSFSHANFEMKSPKFLNWTGKIITSTTYHSLHHSRYTRNYGLGTRILDRIFRTEWEDYEPLYQQITTRQQPLTRLRERVGPPAPRRQSTSRH